MDFKQMHAEFSSLCEELKSADETRTEEIKKLGTASGETKQLMDRINDRIDELEAKMQAPGKAPKMTPENQDIEVKDAFLQGLRFGHESLTPEQRKAVKIVSVSEAKAMNLSSDTAGGYLAYPELVAGIMKEQEPISPLRGLATVKQTSNKSIQIRKQTGTFGAQWVSELGTRNVTGDMAYGMEEISNHELYALVQVSEQLLEDTAFNLEREIEQEAGRQFAIAEALAFMSGDGAGKPEGILFSTDVPVINSGNASAFTADSFINTYYALPDRYAQNASWLMRRSSLRNARLLKDSSGAYIWEKSIAAGQPSTILGAPVVEAGDVPDVTANAKAVIFGDFKTGYLIVDRVNFVVKRLVETGARLGLIEFMIRRRVGGQVINPNALRTMKISA